MPKNLAIGMVTTPSGEYHLLIGTNYAGELTVTVTSATLSKTPGVVDSALLRSKKVALMNDKDSD